MSAELLDNPRVQMTEIPHLAPPGYSRTHQEVVSAFTPLMRLFFQSPYCTET